MPKRLEWEEAPITSSFKEKIEQLRAIPADRQREVANKKGLII